VHMCVVYVHNSRQYTRTDKYSARLCICVNMCERERDIVCTYVCVYIYRQYTRAHEYSVSMCMSVCVRV